MGMEKYIPKSVEEVDERLREMFKQRSHVKTVKVNSLLKQVQVDLDWAANLKVPDFFIPVKSSLVVEAKDVVGRIWNKFQSNHEPDKQDAIALFELVDPGA